MIFLEFLKQTINISKETTLRLTLSLLKFFNFVSKSYYKVETLNNFIIKVRIKKIVRINFFFHESQKRLFKVKLGINQCYF